MKDLMNGQEKMKKITEIFKDNFKKSRDQWFKVKYYKWYNTCFEFEQLNQQQIKFWVH